MQNFDITSLSERTGINVRRLRYCIDKELVPERNWFVSDHEVGRARTFDFITAVLLTATATMLESGCKRDTVKWFMQKISRFPQQGRNPLRRPFIAAAIRGTDQAIIDLGDGTHLRWRSDSFDSGWFAVQPTWRRVKEFEPAVVISLDISQIRRRIGAP